VDARRADRASSLVGAVGTACAYGLRRLAFSACVRDSSGSLSSAQETIARRRNLKGDGIALASSRVSSVSKSRCNPESAFQVLDRTLGSSICVTSRCFRPYCRRAPDGCRIASEHLATRATKLLQQAERRFGFALSCVPRAVDLTPESRLLKGRFARIFDELRDLQRLVSNIARAEKYLLASCVLPHWPTPSSEIDDPAAPAAGQMAVELSTQHSREMLKSIVLRERTSFHLAGAASSGHPLRALVSGPMSLIAPRDLVDERCLATISIDALADSSCLHHQGGQPRAPLEAHLEQLKAASPAFPSGCRLPDCEGPRLQRRGLALVDRLLQSRPDRSSRFESSNRPCDRPVRRLSHRGPSPRAEVLRSVRKDRGKNSISSLSSAAPRLIRSDDASRGLPVSAAHGTPADVGAQNAHEAYLTLDVARVSLTVSGKSGCSTRLVLQLDANHDGEITCRRSSTGARPRELSAAHLRILANGTDLA